MSKNLRLGAASIAFSQPLYIESAASIVSQKEADGPLGDLFDLVCEDPMFGCDTWESAESTLQKETATQAISKAGLSSEDIHLMFAGDLLAQTSATCFGSAGLGIPFYGLYGACSTIGEALSLGSPCSDRRIRHTGLMCHLQPFRKCGKRISFSSGIRKPAAVFCHLDSNRKRCLYPKYISSRRKSSSALRQRLCCYHRPYCRPCDGLRSQGFHEHGRLYGSCSLRYHCTKLFGFRADAFGL